MEAAYSSRLHGITSQKTGIFIVTAMRIPNIILKADEMGSPCCTRGRREK
jgi:hypothetical protein